MVNKNRIISVALSLFVVASIGAAVASARTLHLALVRTVPPKDSVVTATPTVIKLYFSEAVKTAVSGIQLLASDSSKVELAPLTLGTEKVAPLVANIKGKIANGKYRVKWHTLGEDGHAMNESFTFTVKVATPGSN